MGVGEADRFVTVDATRPQAGQKLPKAEDAEKAAAVTFLYGKYIAAF